MEQWAKFLALGAFPTSLTSSIRINLSLTFLIALKTIFNSDQVFLCFLKLLLFGRLVLMDVLKLCGTLSTLFAKGILERLKHLTAALLREILAEGPALGVCLIFFLFIFTFIVVAPFEILQKHCCEE